MKTIMYRIFTLFIFLSLVFFSAGALKCEAGPELVKSQTQDQEEFNDFDLQDDKNSRFQMLVSSIRQNLISKYKQLDELEIEEEYVQLFEIVEVID